MERETPSVVTRTCSAASLNLEVLDLKTAEGIRAFCGDVLGGVSCLIDSSDPFDLKCTLALGYLRLHDVIFPRSFLLRS